MAITLSKVKIAGIVAIGAICSSSAWALNMEDRMAIYDSYALEGQGAIAKAIDKVTGALSRNKTDYFLNYRLGWLFYLAKKYKNSVEHYQQAGNIVTTSVEPWLGASLVYVMSGEYGLSVRMCAEALKRDPQNYTCLQRSVFSWIQLKDYHNALEKVNVALKLYPTDAVFLEQKVAVLQASGKPDEAKDIATVLITVSPKNAYAKKLVTGG
ncbi:MAG: tetratricopeptide repeat protein [Bdellovibrio sp.]|nr:tetratricopeptide repeat protein [Bdellovibrio sp.]